MLLKSEAFRGGAFVERKTVKYSMDFTRRFDWEDGDFGDRGSAFWGQNHTARHLLERAGAFAVRFYNTYGKGFARAFVCPVLNENCWVVFNNYGIPLWRIAKILASYNDCNYKRVTLFNNGTSKGEIYINGGVGYLLGNPNIITNVEWVDLGIR